MEELANRKILEEIQLKKQMLLKQGAVTPLTATIPLTPPSPVGQLPMCSIPPVSATAQMMSAILKLKTLESCLQELNGFSKPKLDLEQYETPAHIAAIALHTIQTRYGDIEDKLILDAGCGTGKFALGAAMLGAGAVTALDIDKDALDILKINIEEQEIKNVDVVHCDFLNNPIGRLHIEKKLKDWNVKGNVIAELKFNIHPTYKFHREQSRDIAVDIWRMQLQHL
ncbi:Methyltransferase-like protein 5 [Eumeta japonica]|uniref:Methyltransferase-like protein 5 n=1 Tax=Eumeta variegata TaxID=151549 RepID=A0A4C1YWP9_EUMVA|nr:Methyltransferase-like protein 5 [Eumeta japonica]